MKCNYCEYEVSEDCKCCPNCGEDPKTRKKNKIKDQVKEEKEKETVVRTVNTENMFIIYGVISFFIPFIGLILFIVLNKTKPKEAKAAGIGALARVAMYIFYLLLFGVFHYITNR